MSNMASSKSRMIYNTPFITSLNCAGEVHLLVGTQSLGSTISRVKAVIASGAQAKVVNMCSENDFKKIQEHFYGDERVCVFLKPFALQDLTTLGRQFVGGIVDKVFVNLPQEEALLMQDIFKQCLKLRIPINTSQRPEMSTFSPLSTYSDPEKSGLQIAVTTNGQGCLLANRIKREIVARLPSNISKAVTNMGQLRDRIINEDHTELITTYHQNSDLQELGYGVDEDVWDSQKLNKLVYEFSMTEKEQKLKRTRWLSQIMQYYPLSTLADVSIDQLADSYRSEYAEKNASSSKQSSAQPDHKARGDTSEENTPAVPAVAVSKDDVLKISNEKGRIALVGSGPGSISMLTLGALHEIKTADLVLADKLVPEEVLQLIPSGTETFIARKFPGNAERAQNELLEKGLAGLKDGKRVVRLKQGDPYIFGRGGEEYLFFSQHGFEPEVLPGLSSALTSTVVSKIPATQRDVADQVLICTGTGRKGALPDIPEFVSTRTTVFLMALHRSSVLIEALLSKGWDPEVPAAIIERASCPDQRITRTSLKYVPEVVEEIGSRPPGLLVVGRSVTALLSEEKVRFNDTRKFYIEEGYHYDQHNVALTKLASAYHI